MSRMVGDETVLMDLATGTYFGLDGVGKRIWESIAEGSNLAAVVTVITTEFEVEQARAQEDVIEFVSELVDRGLLQAN